MVESETNLAVPEQGAPPLPDDYYVQAFLVVLDTVAEGSGDLLNPAEHLWMEQLRGLPDGARRLYVRLLQRRSATFRLSKLAYEEIPDIDKAAAELVEAGLAVGAAPHAIDDLVAAFTVPELKRLTSSACASNASRSERVAALLARDLESDRVALSQADSWLTILGHEHFTLCRLCFFGNLYQDMSEFVTTALGTNRYQPVALERNSRHFQSRDQLEAHVRYYECAQCLDHLQRSDRAGLRELVAALPERIEGDQHLDRRLDRLRIELARVHERLGDDQTADTLYRLCQRGSARERRVRLLERNERDDEAKALLCAMRRAPESEAEFDFAIRKLEPGNTAARSFRPRSSTLVLAASDARVEQTAAQYFARDGACHWVENRLFSTVLGLWIWDIVFMPVRGAFFNPFQSAPADFRHRGFRQARSDALARRFDELDNQDSFEQRIRETLSAHQGISNPLVSWQLARSPVLELALHRIPRSDFAAIFQRMLDDPAEHTSGLPDLVLFPHAGSYELIEIKGPGDALQANQRRWFRYFDAHEIPARVVKVRWAKSHD